MADPKADNWRATVRKRVLVLGAICALWLTAIEVRLVQLQVFQRGALQTIADRAHKQKVAVQGRRGEILDRHGRVLAFSLDADTIFAVPSAIQDPAGTVAKLCAALGCSDGEREVLAERLSRRSAFAFVRRQVTAEEKARVQALKLPGIDFRKDSQRVYPNKELAAHLLGFVGTDERNETDSKGLEGIEAAYNAPLAGTPGQMLLEVDARNKVFSRIGTPPSDGQTLELTIDEVLQHIAERELEAGVAANRAAGGCVIIMDPHTGEILAIANAPTYDPNAWEKSEVRDRRNRAVQDLYEPGSTFKIVTASAAIEEGVVKPSEVIDVSAGRIQIGRSRIIEDDHRSGPLTFTDVIVKSSNVGAVTVGRRLGAERLGRYVGRFGFGARLSPDFPAENAGIVWNPDRWSDSALASVSMGYEIGVTPLQMATAASAVANGGMLVRPRVVRALVKGNVRTEVPHSRIKQAIAPATASELTAIMEGVVERGTATAAKMAGFTVAGKTGTAAKLVNGRYSDKDYNASFVGFLPSRAPVLTILVMIDSPHAGPIYGGAVAAPIFKRIAEAAMGYLGVSPSINPAPALLVARGPAPPEARAPTPTTVLPAAAGPDGDGTAWPDLRGLGLRETIRVLARLGATARVTGAGVVLEQDPPPGSALEPGTVCRLVLGRSTARTSVNGSHP